MTANEMTARYDIAAPRWGARIAALGYDAAYQGFVARAIRHADGLVCDLGCGSGGFARAGLAAGIDLETLTLVDPSRGMLAEAGRGLRVVFPGVQTVLASLETYAPATLHDLILSAHMVEHCGDLDLALRRIAALLAPGGILLLVVSRPHWCQWLIWPVWRHRWFSAVRVRDAGTAAGLRLDLIHNFLDGPPSRTSLG